MQEQMMSTHCTAMCDRVEWRTLIKALSPESLHAEHTIVEIESFVGSKSKDLGGF
jgi:hypothetical protein